MFLILATPRTDNVTYHPFRYPSNTSMSKARNILVLPFYDALTDSDESWIHLPPSSASSNNGAKQGLLYGFSLQCLEMQSHMRQACVTACAAAVARRSRVTNGESCIWHIYILWVLGSREPEPVRRSPWILINELSKVCPIIIIAPFPKHSIESHVVIAKFALWAVV